MISGVILTLASIYLLGAITQVIKAENEPKVDNSQTDHLQPKISYPELSNSYINNLTTTFYVDDIFAVNNPMQTNLFFSMKNIHTHINVTIIQLQEGSDLSWVDNPNIDKYLKYAKDNDRYITIDAFLSPNLNETILYTPSDETQQNIIVFMKPVNSNGSWWHFEFPLTKIYPAWTLQQVKTNKAIQNQIAETKRSNDITTGLTYVIISAIPIGLVAEFWIEYMIENHFYRKEKVKTINKTDPWNCDFFPDKESPQK